MSDFGRVIDPAEPWLLGYWAARLDVSEDRLREAVNAVGTSVADVKRYLCQ